MSLFVTIVLDGVGIGSQDDASEYGDAGSNTLLHVLERQGPSLPNLAAAGLGCVSPLPGIVCPSKPSASFGKMTERSAGKDSTTGHWELAGISLSEPFPTYPDGFPVEVIDLFVQTSGCSGILGNKAASGTAIIEELGAAHLETGFPIVYTSADSVFQIAAHKDIIPLDKLYELCTIARERVCVGKHAVGRVIARPFGGSVDSFARVSHQRKDFSYLPPTPPVQSILQENGIKTVSIGKVSDLFGGVGFDEKHKTVSNADGIEKTIGTIKDIGAHDAFVWVNLVDFDQEFGHRNDPAGFARCLEEFDDALPIIRAALPAESVLVLTADHGNDPTYPGTDHTREHVPLLVYDGGNGRGLGNRATFSDHAASVLDYFKVASHEIAGESFLRP